MLYYMYDIMLYIYYTVLNLLPPITYPPFPKREIYQFTVLPFYHPNNAPLLFNTRALLINNPPLLINMRSLLKKFWKSLAVSHLFTYFAIVLLPKSRFRVG